MNDASTPAVFCGDGSRVRDGIAGFAPAGGADRTTSAPSSRAHHHTASTTSVAQIHVNRCTAPPCVARSLWRRLDRIKRGSEHAAQYPGDNNLKNFLAVIAGLAVVIVTSTGLD